MKRYVKPHRRRKLTVRNIEVNTAASLPIFEKVEPELRRRRQQVSSRVWTCDDILLRRRGNGMPTQYLQELGRPHIVSKAESWNMQRYGVVNV